MSDRPVLVTGAGGKTGLAVTRALAARGERARALIRSSAQKERVRRAGAEEVVVGDLREVDAVVQAVTGVRSVYLICPNVSPDEEAIGRGMIAACREAGIDRLVYHSVLHPQIEAMPHHWAKMRVEEALFESGLAWTILQPAAYLQNLLAGWREIVEEGRYRVPYAAGTRLGMVDLTDVAEVAARVLSEESHRYAIYELAGSEILTQVEVARSLSGALGRSVEVEAVSRTAWRESALAAGLPASAADVLLAMFRYYERHGFWGNPTVLTRLLGRSPTRLAEFLAGVVAG